MYFLKYTEKHKHFKHTSLIKMSLMDWFDSFALCNCLSAILSIGLPR